MQLGINHSLVRSKLILVSEIFFTYQMKHFKLDFWANEDPAIAFVSTCGSQWKSTLRYYLCCYKTNEHVIFDFKIILKKKLKSQMSIPASTQFFDGAIKFYGDSFTYLFSCHKYINQQKQEHVHVYSFFWNEQKRIQWLPWWGSRQWTGPHPPRCLPTERPRPCPPSHSGWRYKHSLACISHCTWDISVYMWA